MVSVEDRRYYSHFGVDPIGIARRARSLASGKSRGRIDHHPAAGPQRCSSTTAAPSAASCARRCWRWRWRWKFSKDEILELYLNKVYFGGGAYGIDAASRKFFGHPATELSLPEAAIIAGWSRRRRAIRPPPTRGRDRPRQGGAGQ
jgi:penicillin-binding protein 1A